MQLRLLPTVLHEDRSQLMKVRFEEAGELRAMPESSNDEDTPVTAVEVVVEVVENPTRPDTNPPAKT